MKLLKQPKSLNRLQARREAHVETSREDKVRTRWRTGGYKRPGSLKKAFPRGRRKTH